MTMMDPRSHDLPQIMADMHRKIKDMEVQLATLRTQTTLDHGTMGGLEDNDHTRYDFGHFKPYGPSWWCDTTAPFLGNGVLTGRYCRINELVFVYLNFQAGTTTTFGAGNFNFSMPVPFRANGYSQQIHAFGGDLFVAEFHGFGLADKNDSFLPQSVQVELANATLGPARINSTFPFTWGNGDYLQLQGWYEAAP